MTDLSVPNETNWLFAKDNDIDHLQWSDDLREMEHIDLANSNIYSIGQNFFSKLATSGNARLLNLAGNKFKGFNKDLTRSQLHEVYLSGNPIECNCDMFWFVEWLNTTYYPSGPRIVKDYRDVKCVGGEWDGVEVNKLSKEQMGCLPTVLEL